MKYIKGDLLESDEWGVAIQICNLYHCFGSGIAKSIREKFPKVYNADLATVNGDESKLGTFSYGETNDYRHIFNIYAMIGLGNDSTPLGRNLSYDHFYNALYKICKEMPTLYKVKIGCPKFLGCCRAGGSWVVVESILKDMESMFDVEFVIHEFGDEVTAQSTQPK